jgi:hypothetical protein
MPLDIRRGPTAEPLRIVLHGQEGVGKTTWAAGCPDALFITAEDGGGDLDYARVVVDTWPDLRRTVRALIADPQGFTTVVIDTISSFERLCWAAVCEDANNARSIEDVGGGYGKGYTAALEEMTSLASDLDQLRARQRVHVIVLAHSQVKVFNDPLGNPFDRYELRMHAKSAGMWLGWADCVLFACFDVTVKTAKKRAEITEKGKATDAKRVIYTTKEAAYDAKNRYGLPEELPLKWADFAKAIAWERRDEAIRGPKLDANGRHPSWEADRERFCAALGELGLPYDGVRDWHVANYKSKPSGLTSAKRTDLLAYLRGNGKSDVTAWLARGAPAAE